MARRPRKRRTRRIDRAFAERKLNNKMRKKLVWSFGVVILALVGLAFRITYINATSGEKYKKQVLTQSQQQYDSRVIPFKRGDILDKSGTILATSEKVYNVILDCKVVNSSEKYLEPTIKALTEVLGFDEELVRTKLTDEETKSSQYQILKKGVSITDKKDFEDYCDTTEKEMSKEEITERQNVKGVWFEEDYLRTYPMNSLASDVIGFTYSGNAADWGIEGYYSSTLNGVNGRQYGYFNSDADVEQTIIEPQSGSSVVSTIDVTIQETVERYIQDLMDGLANGPNGEKGAKNVGVIVADPNTGGILAMASSDPYDLNNPRDLTPFYTQEEIDAMSDETMIDSLNSIWKNYCISDTYEPGSTVKPMSVAAALESGDISYDDTFYCGGYEMVSGEQIKCSVYPGEHGTQTIAEVMKNSCNSALMQMAEKMGVENFIRYENIFNFGLKTGIDLPGEAAGIVHTTDSMGSVELATSSFGQGFTSTMVQEVAALSSVVNGGYYYKPHIVSKILDSSGAVVKSVEPVLMKQTVSEEVSAHIREYMGTVMESGGTGKYAKVAGYSMGGKTGTAQKIPRGNNKYLVSFVGFAPLDDPQVVVYVVVDEPNVEMQSTSTYAQYVSRNIMADILPYLNIFPDEGTDSSSGGTGITLDDIFAMEGEDRIAYEGVADPAVPEPLEDDEEVEGGNTRNDEGYTNEEAGLENEQ